MSLDFNRKTVCFRFLILCCLLETSLSNVYGSGAGASVVEVEATVARVPLKPRHLGEFCTDKTETEIQGIVKLGVQAKLAKNFDLAISLFEEASRYRSIAAMAFLGSCYEVKENYYVAYLWYKEAVALEGEVECVLARKQLGNPEFIRAMSASRDLACKQAILTDGVSAFQAGLYAKAAEFFEISGLPAALCNLGVLHAQGNLEEVNFVKAAEYFERSGTPDAWHNLGIFRMQGKLGEVDFVKAAEYFERSGTPDAWHNLGILHMQGKLAPRIKLTKGIECFERSGQFLSLYILYDIYSKLRKEKVEEIKARMLAGIKAETYPKKKLFYEGLYLSLSGNYAHALEKLEAAKQLGNVNPLAHIRMFQENIFLEELLAAAIEAGSETVFPVLDVEEPFSNSEKEVVAAIAESSADGREVTASAGASADTSSSDFDSHSHSEYTKEEFGEFDLHKALREQLAQKVERLATLGLTETEVANFSFKNNHVKREFDSIEKDKVGAMCAEIQQNPWTLKGLGKP